MRLNSPTGLRKAKQSQSHRALRVCSKSTATAAIEEQLGEQRESAPSSQRRLEPATSGGGRPVHPVKSGITTGEQEAAPLQFQKFS